jgi:hypothetical protein
MRHPNVLQRCKRPPGLGCGPLPHAATENCKMSVAGVISPCSISSAITRRARDLTFRVASSGVAAYTVTPGSSGMSPIQRLSVSREQPDGELHMTYPTTSAPDHCSRPFERSSERGSLSMNPRIRLAVTALAFPVPTVDSPLTSTVLPVIIQP